MGNQSGQNVLRILPDCLGNNQWRMAINLGEDLNALLLRGDETVAGFWINAMSARRFPTQFFDCRDQATFHTGLFRPALNVCAFTQVTVGDKNDILHVVSSSGTDALSSTSGLTALIRQDRLIPKAKHSAASHQTKCVHGIGFLHRHWHLRRPL